MGSYIKKIPLILIIIFLLCGCNPIKTSDTRIVWKDDDEITADAEAYPRDEGEESSSASENTENEENTDVEYETDDDLPNYDYETSAPVQPKKTATPRPNTTPKPAKAPKKSLQVAGTTVYRTNSGKKFHRETCGSLSKSKIPILYEDAVKKGLTPCGTCKP